MKISVCGKGGSGKSTLVSLLAKQAEARGLKVLVVDSDESNSGLFHMLGFKQPPVPLMELVGGKNQLREKMKQPDIWAEQWIDPSDIPSTYVQRRNGMMMVSIGKILQSFEGCACPMWVLSREFLSKLRLGENALAIVDMEAGVEHFGRGIEKSIDTVLLVIEPSMESIYVAEKIRDMTAGLEKRLVAVLNKIGSGRVAMRMEKEILTRGIELIGVLRLDPAIFEACLEGFAMDRGEAFRQAGDILDRLLVQV